jgi:multidrug efflux pump subunit AcrA (membrane-fusion protein)
MLPQEFVFEENGAKKVYVREGGRKSAVPIFVGIAWNGSVEILEGLSEGARVLRP